MNTNAEAYRLTPRGHRVTVFDVFTSADPRDSHRPPYQVVGFTEDGDDTLVDLKALPEFADWPINRYAETTQVNLKRFHRGSQKGWLLYA